MVPMHRCLSLVWLKETLELTEGTPWQADNLAYLAWRCATRRGTRSCPGLSLTLPSTTFRSEYYSWTQTSSLWGHSHIAEIRGLMVTSTQGLFEYHHPIWRLGVAFGFWSTETSTTPADVAMNCTRVSVEFDSRRSFARSVPGHVHSFVRLCDKEDAV